MTFNSKSSLSAYLAFSSSEKSTQKIQRKLNLRVSKKQIYQEAFTHSSVNLKNSNGQTINFERLEFLGDALLASIVAEYLFEYYPNAKEGELTKLRAKIVSRSKLNEIGKRMDLFKFAKISFLSIFFSYKFNFML